MSKVLILVEGQTEETFVREVLYSHLSTVGVYPIAKLATMLKKFNVSIM